MMSGKIHFTCRHCGVHFLPTDSQWEKRYCRPIKTCSRLCSFALVPRKAKKFNGHLILCAQCGNTFRSKRAGKKFCNLRCYHASPQFRVMTRDNCRIGNEKQRMRGVSLRGEVRACLECGKEVYAKPSRPNRKYCSHAHYRQYMAKRFDRHIASPEEIALPQNYDEFLTKPELNCLVSGCGWRGHLLSNHMNYSHGVTAAEFKRAAGFNLGTGVVSAPMHGILSDRENVGIALETPSTKQIAHARSRARLKRLEPGSYKSLEGKEHALKGRLIKLSESNCPVRECLCCQQLFVQSTPFGYAKYCSLHCRETLYSDIKAQRKFDCICGNCGKKYSGNIAQELRRRRGWSTVCSLLCRNTMNARAHLGARAPEGAGG